MKLEELYQPPAVITPEELKRLKELSIIASRTSVYDKRWLYNAEDLTDDDFI